MQIFAEKFEEVYAENTFGLVSREKNRHERKKTTSQTSSNIHTAELAEYTFQNQDQKH